MMTLATITAKKTYTFDEYLQLEEKAKYKSEFRNGKIMPMPHGTAIHALIIGSLYFYLKQSTKLSNLKSLACNSEMRVFIEAINESLYPDGSLIVGESIFYKKNKAITNPSIIFEVLSESTEGYDRGGKFRKYKHLASFQEYVLIEQSQPAIDVLYKREDGVWEMTSFIGLDEVLELKTLDIKIPLKDIYEDVLDSLSLPQYKIDLE